MSNDRIIDVQLDERTILWRSADVEQERRVAIFDLLEGNSFRLVTPRGNGYPGPYKVELRVEDGRLAILLLERNARGLTSGSCRAEMRTPPKRGSANQ